MIPILAAMVDITGGPDGGHVVVDPPIAIGALYLFLLLLPLMLVIVLAYYRSKFRHQQILAAMEKGLPVADLIANPRNEINWVRNLSAGIGLTFIGVVMGVLFFATKMINSSTPKDELFGMLLVPTVIFGLGLIFLLRGLLQKSREKQKDIAG